MSDVTVIEGLIGKTLASIDGDAGSEQLVFKTTDGESYRMYHSQDCCEHVSIEDITGDLKDLIGNPLLRAEERSEEGKDNADSSTWTFYEFATIKGSVTIRWYGSSNGYYSEGVSFYKDE